MIELGWVTVLRAGKPAQYVTGHPCLQPNHPRKLNKVSEWMDES